MTGLAFEDYLRVEAAGQHTVALKLVHVDMAGDLMAGVLLSQLVYWHSPNRETGESRLTVEREGHRWLRKTYDEWYDECRLTVAQARRAVDQLRDRDLIETRVWRYGGTPTLHLRIDGKEFMAAFDAATSQVSPEMRHSANGLVAHSDSAPEMRHGADGNAPQRESEMRHGASHIGTETTTETTSETTNPPTPQPTLALVAQARPADLPLELFKLWQADTGHKRAVFDPDRRRYATRAIKDHGFDYCAEAVAGWRNSPHHRGENKSGTIYNDFGLIFRNAKQVEMFHGFADGSNLARPTRHGMTDWRAIGQQWAEGQRAIGASE